MKNNIGLKIVIGIVLLVMVVPIIADGIANTVLTKIKYNNLEDTVKNTSNYDFALVYVASSSDKDVKSQKDAVKELTSQYKSVSNGKTLKSFYIDSKNLESSDREEIFGEDSSAEEGYMFIVNGEVTKTIEGELNEDELRDLVEFYSANAEKISEDLVNYKEPENYKEFDKIVKEKDKVNMLVFGRDSCFYCNQFKIVYNTVIEEYDLDSIYYIDSDKFASEEEQEEYNKMLDSGLKIPAKCSSTNEEVELQSGFGTPLTLFTKNGKVIDCLNGYANKKNLITTLETVGIIKAD